jgi:hypothetical protein
MNTFSIITPTLLDKKPSGIVLSASQLEKWDLCKRWWAWQYIAGIRSPPHPSAILGTKVHGHLEAWLKSGTAPVAASRQDVDVKAAALAKRMITTLIENGIQPGQGVVERNFWFTTHHGHHYTGFIDWSGLVESFATVADHKTSGNIDAYGKTEADLHNDIQAVLYSIAGFVGFGVDTLQLFWNYGETKGRFKTAPIKTVVRLSVVTEKFEKIIEPEAAQIISHRAAKTHPLSFPPTVSACGAFGGCPHRQRCNLTKQQLLGDIMNNGQGQQSMADRMAALSGGVQHVAPPQMAPAMAPPHQFQPQQPQHPDWWPQQPPPQMAPQPQPQPQQPQQPQMAPQQPPQQMAPQQPPQQMAPQQPPQQPPPQMAPQEPQEPQEPQQAYAPTLAPNPPESGNAPPPQEKQTPPGEEKNKGRGRPAGSKNKKTFTTEQQVYMMGVTALIGHPQFNPNDASALQLIESAGELALVAYQKRFD